MQADLTDLVILWDIKQTLSEKNLSKKSEKIVKIEKLSHKRHLDIFSEFSQLNPFCYNKIAKID